MIRTLDDFAPPGSTAGVGLTLLDEQGRYLFFLAGTRYHCPPGELFYAGIGGHREAGEGWLDCAHREAREEIGTDVEILPSPVTWHVSRHGRVRRVRIAERPQPLALYEMVPPAGMYGAGELYRIVIYQATLQALPTALAAEEVRAVLALTREQVQRGIAGQVALADLLAAGAALVAGGEGLAPDVRLYPIGTARALGEIFGRVGAGQGGAER